MNGAREAMLEAMSLMGGNCLYLVVPLQDHRSAMSPPIIGFRASASAKANVVDILLTIGMAYAVLDRTSVRITGGILDVHKDIDDELMARSFDDALRAAENMLESVGDEQFTRITLHQNSKHDEGGAK